MLQSVQGHTGLAHHFYFFDIPALWCSGLSDRVPECQKIEKGGLDQYGPECSGRLIFATVRKMWEGWRVNICLLTTSNSLLASFDAFQVVFKKQLMGKYIDRVCKTIQIVIRQLWHTSCLCITHSQSIIHRIVTETKKTQKNLPSPDLHRLDILTFQQKQLQLSGTNWNNKTNN